MLLSLEECVSWKVAFEQCRAVAAMAESFFSDAEMAAKTDKGFGQTTLFLEAKTQNLYHTAFPRQRNGCYLQLSQTVVYSSGV